MALAGSRVLCADSPLRRAFAGPLIQAAGASLLCLPECFAFIGARAKEAQNMACLLYTSPSPRD